MKEEGSTMISQGRRFFLIYMLIIVIMGAGLLTTYQVMVKTTGTTAPALISLQSIGMHWELEVLGLQYKVNKEDLQLSHLKARAFLLTQQSAAWAEIFLQEVVEFLAEASNLVFDRLLRNKV